MTSLFLSLVSAFVSYVLVKTIVSQLQKDDRFLLVLTREDNPLCIASRPMMIEIYFCGYCLEDWVATMSSRCKSVHECPLGTRGSLGCHVHATQLVKVIFTAFVQDYLSENFSFNGLTKLVSRNYDLIFPDKYLDTWTTVKLSLCQTASEDLQNLVGSVKLVIDFSVLMFVSLNSTLDMFELIIDWQVLKSLDVYDVFVFVLARSSLVIKHTGWSFGGSFGLFSSKRFRQRMHIFTGQKNMPWSVCFSSKFDGHLSTPGISHFNSSVTVSSAGGLSGGLSGGGRFSSSLKWGFFMFFFKFYYMCIPHNITTFVFKKK